MRFTKCGSENPDTKRFCGDCGGVLANRCAKCGADNPPSKMFCGDCGNPLTVSPSPPPSVVTAGAAVRVAPESSSQEAVEGERKTVTALFADIKGSTELEQDLDPEEARAIVDPALKTHRYRAIRNDQAVLRGRISLMTLRMLINARKSASSRVRRQRHDRRPRAPPGQISQE